MPVFYVPFSFSLSGKPYTKRVENVDTAEAAEKYVQRTYPEALSIGPAITAEEYRRQRKAKVIKVSAEVIVEAMAEHKVLREKARLEEIERNKDRKEFGEWA